MKWDLRKAYLVSRDPSQPADAPEMLVGDVYEFTDPPFYEVDPRTLKATKTLQQFRVKNSALELEILHSRIPQ